MVLFSLTATCRDLVPTQVSTSGLRATRLTVRVGTRLPRLNPGVNLMFPLIPIPLWLVKITWDETLPRLTIGFSSIRNT